uniref:Titin n=1 Tax=Naja naja TaxID=35670 RepID=A0A8C6V7B5_NAJNA
MTVSWHRPDSDGGSEIIGYIVEKRDRTGIRWVKCNKRRITDLRLRVTGLAEDHEYEFRVSAENIAGIGEPSQITPYWKACDPMFKPGPPTNAHVVDTTKNSITTAWGKPIYDGGCEILGYIVEICKADEEEWAMVTPQTGLRVNRFEIKKLIEHQEYKLRVCALNKIGVGEPAAIPGTIKPEDKLEAPELDIDSELRKGIVVRAGSSVRINIPFKGRPTPEISWSREEGEFTDKVQIEKGINYTQLSIDYCDRNDAGKYILKLENSSGSKSAFVTVKVLDTPGPPQNLVVKEIRKDCAVLTWEPPANDGGAKIKNYVIDKRESTRKAYANVSAKCNKTSFRVENLIEGSIYYFRVMAENEFGIGSPAETADAAKASEPPLPPGKVTLTDVTQRSASFMWEKPEHDGGSRILGYIVEMQPKGSDKWTVVTETKVCNAVVSGLSSGQEYQFRVMAYNEKGKSDPKPLAVPVIAKDQTIQPTGEDLKVEIPFIARPKPTITWEKDGQPLKQTTRLHYNFRICAMNSEGVGEPATIPGSVVAAEKMEPPEIELDADLRKVVTVRASGTLRLFVTIKGRPEPEVKWEKAEGTMSDRAQIEVTSSYTMLVIDNVNRFDSGKYNLTLENNSGKKSAFVNVRVLDTPSAPVNLTVREVKKDLVTLAWEPPLIDGGAKITNYIIEKRETTRKAYATITNNCNKNVFRIEQLLEGCSYYFRVLAANEYGVGLPAETSEPVKVSEPPYPPGKVTLVDVTRHSASIKWEKPESDGGSKITGYVVEMQTKGSEKWSTCTQVKTLEATISGLSMGEEYTFRVCAINEKGKSDPRQLGVPVVAKDIEIQPSVELLFNTFSVKAGEDLKIDIPIRGRPVPSASWKKDGMPLRETTRVNVHTSKTSTSLVIKEASREDVGKYELNVASSAGSTTALINVIVLDRPGPPTSLRIDNVSADNISISWEPPEYDGGCQINNYIVEKRETTTTTWSIVSAAVARTSIKIVRLTTGSEYQFRVSAENRYGKSTYAETAPVVAEYPFSLPGPPGTPQVVHATKAFMIVTGEIIKINSDIAGRPLPIVSWTKDGKDIEEKARVEIVSTDHSTAITIKDCIRRDSGQYVLTLQNVAGTRSLAVNCKVLDRPGPPAAPLEIKGLTSLSMHNIYLLSILQIISMHLECFCSQFIFLFFRKTKPTRKTGSIKNYQRQCVPCMAKTRA